MLWFDIAGHNFQEKCITSYYLKKLVESVATNAQYFGKKLAEFCVKIGMDNIATNQISSAFTSYSEAWLPSSSLRCIFMSYFIELPNLGLEGLAKTYRLLNDVASIVTIKDYFNLSGSIEFLLCEGG